MVTLLLSVFWDDVMIIFSVLMSETLPNYTKPRQQQKRLLGLLKKINEQRCSQRNTFEHQGMINQPKHWIQPKPNK
jgi:hypothetical protein